MHTLSGKRFELGGSFVPTVRDVAVGLSRIPRWAGATIVPWTVLQHSLACYRITAESGLSPETQLLALWHDCEEMATNDIPKPFKTPEQVALGDTLRVQLYRGALGMPEPRDFVWQPVHMADETIRDAEAHCLCHPTSRADFGLPFTPAVDAVWDLIPASPNDTIAMFVNITGGLLKDKTIRALQTRA